ncbi:MAG TPA: hypothetical protein VGT04_02470 [Acidobacteriaceae bacterium]|nr:hypothetical protein [Acidobacteriaceae bacterium]
MPRPTYLPECTLSGCDAKLQETSLLDFWKWAFSDLCDDDLKGIFAEWIVLRLLQIQSVRRVSWANSDIITVGGARIEIKASSYWQSWKLLDETGALRPTPIHPISSEAQIRFAGLKARNATDIADIHDPRLYKSDIYIFAFQREKDIEGWNAMDLSQWEFYALPVAAVSALGWSSISLPMLRSEQMKLCGQATLTADSLADVVQPLIAVAENAVALASEE